MHDKPVRLLRCWFLFAVLAIAACGPETTVIRDVDHVKQIQYMYRDYKAEMFPALSDIGPLEAQALIEEGRALLVDARSAEEQAVSIIPGAIMAADLDTRSIDRHTTLIVYCTIGVRSAFACNGFLQKNHQALNLRGGIINWVAHGLAVHHDGKPVKRVHTYGKKWALVAPNYEVVY